MPGDIKGLKQNWKERTDEAREKANKAISELSTQEKDVNFSSVWKLSGVSKSFLYDDKEIRERIEKIRGYEMRKEINQRAKFDKTSKSKDIIIESKDKRIAKLEEENRRLRDEVERLRGKFYEMD